MSFRESMKVCKWGPTLGLHLMRSLSAGLIWSIVMLVAGSKDMPPFMPMIIVVGFYFVTVWMFMGVCKFMSIFVGGLADLIWNLFTLVAALGIAVGDPVLFFLNKCKPGLLPVQKFNFVNFAMILWVTDPEKI